MEDPAQFTGTKGAVIYLWGRTGSLFFFSTGTSLIRCYLETLLSVNVWAKICFLFDFFLHFLVD